MNIIGVGAANLDAESTYYAALLGCLELVQSGCTTIVDNHWGFPSAAVGDSLLQAFRDIDVRGIEARSVMGVDRFDALSGFEDLRQVLLEDRRQGLDDTLRLKKRCQGDDGLVDVWFSPDSLHFSSFELLEETTARARELGMWTCIHLEETQEGRIGLLGEGIPRNGGRDNGEAGATSTNVCSPSIVFRPRRKTWRCWRGAGPGYRTTPPATASSGQASLQ